MGIEQNEHIYSVSPEFQAWWEERCTEPYKGHMEKMQAWGAWKHQQDIIDGLKAHSDNLHQRGDEYCKTVSELKPDAERWQALISCERIRILGSARLGGDNQHIGMEVWERYPNVQLKEILKDDLFTFVDTIRKRP